jgi:hypothetical protein
LSPQGHIINDEEGKVALYLANLKMLWELGAKDASMEGPKIPSPMEGALADKIGPPGDNHASIWKEKRSDEIPGDWIITRIGERAKGNNDWREQFHYKSYPPLGGSTTVAAHRAINEKAGLKWEPFNHGIRSILWWDATYPDGPIIRITRP